MPKIFQQDLHLAAIPGLRYDYVLDDVGEVYRIETQFGIDSIIGREA